MERKSTPRQKRKSGRQRWLYTDKFKAGARQKPGVPPAERFVLPHILPHPGKVRCPPTSTQGS